MAPRNKAAVLAAGGALVGGSAFLGSAFVPQSLSPAAPQSSTRATASQSIQSSQTVECSVSVASVALAGFAAALGVQAASMSRSPGPRAQRVLMNAEATPAEAAAAPVEEIPPPPPPFDPATQVGAMAPLGFFDPAKFSVVGDEKGFRTYREAELKHGRVAMLASLGAVVQHYIKFPGFDSVPAGMGAIIQPPGTFGLLVLFGLAGFLETQVWTQDPNKEVGDFGDPLGMAMYTEDMRNKEINNGRFAMFAAIGIILADTATGKDAIQQFGL